jgi:hypothetical protein
MQVLLSLSYFDYPSRNGLDQLLGKCITQYFSHGNIHPNSSKKRKHPSKLNALAVCMWTDRLEIKGTFSAVFFLKKERRRN